ncbi:hypothetical protein EYF80_048947 [Liparis tanakae]|uniref:Uncharacterized protein n=1 Tax=Liparis tanakae TaxID=230148 RepID=A0A4Z2FJC9_9TELE|nr:hypothetical protein EYF80_048947 [Liparis tanakae]
MCFIKLKHRKKNRRGEDEQVAEERKCRILLIKLSTSSRCRFELITLNASRGGSSAELSNVSLGAQKTKPGVLQFTA